MQETWRAVGLTRLHADLMSLVPVRCCCPPQAGGVRGNVVGSICWGGGKPSEELRGHGGWSQREAHKGGGGHARPPEPGQGGNRRQAACMSSWIFY